MGSCIGKATPSLGENWACSPILAMTAASLAIDQAQAHKSLHFNKLFNKTQVDSWKTCMTHPPQRRKIPTAAIQNLEDRVHATIWASTWTVLQWVALLPFFQLAGLENKGSPANS